MIFLYLFRKLIGAGDGVVMEQTRREMPNCPVCKNKLYVEREKWDFACSNPTHERLKFKAGAWADPDSQAAIQVLEEARKQWDLRNQG